MAKEKKMTENKLLFHAVHSYCQQNFFDSPIAEHPFSKGLNRDHRFDCCWLDKKVAIEFQGGGQFGRHATFYGYNNDCIKFTLANFLGWTVYPITTHQFEKGMAFVIVDFIFGKKLIEESSDAIRSISEFYKRKTKKKKKPSGSVPDLPAKPRRMGNFKKRRKK